MLRDPLREAYRRLGAAYPRVAIALQFQFGFLVVLGGVFLLKLYVDLPTGQFLRILLVAEALAALETVLAIGVAFRLLRPADSWLRGNRTPRAMIADNDYGLGQVVQEISHSAVWKESAIFVVEDDSQDGADHVDAHRIPAFVISPFAKPGAVIHTRYDMLSMIRSLELILGMRPLSLGDGLATPMYDVFRATPRTDSTVYTAIQPDQSLTATNSAGAPAAQASARLPFTRVDAVPQAVSDRILWQAVHGARSRPPAPGPNASREEHERALEVLRELR